jgi:hypothetical protein
MPPASIRFYQAACWPGRRSGEFKGHRGRISH